MRRSFFKELEALEKTMLRRQIRRSATTTGSEQFRKLLNLDTTERVEQESGAETAARIAGISTRQLRKLLSDQYRP